MVFGIAIIMIWPEEIRNICCKSANICHEAPHHHHLSKTEVYSISSSSVNTINFNQAVKPSEKLQKLILTFFEENNLINFAQLGHPIYTMQDAKNLLHDKADRFTEDPDAIISKLYQFVLEHIENESRELKILRKIEMSGEQSGSGSGDLGSGDFPVVDGLERSSRNHIPAHLRNRAIEVVRISDDYLPKIDMEKQWKMMDEHFLNVANKYSKLSLSSVYTYNNLGSWHIRLIWASYLNYH